MADYTVDIDNWDKSWKCWINYQNAQNAAATDMAGLVSLALIPKYLGAYKDSKRRVQQISTRLKNIAVRDKNEYLTKQYPQIVHALECALAIEYPELDAECKTVEPIKNDFCRRYYTCGSDACEDDTAYAIASVEAQSARLAFNRRRYERMINLKQRAVQGAHSVSKRYPQSAQGLLNNAAQIYADFFQNARTQLSGALAGLGAGIGGFGDGSGLF